MLLHVVAAALAVPAVHAVLAIREASSVEDLAALLDHRHDARAAQRPHVPRLAAALSVERGAVQDHGGPVRWRRRATTTASKSSR
jgi:hypothetical protein